MEYSVTVREVQPHWIVAARGQGPMLSLLDKVWDFVRKSGLKTDGQNVAIYKREGIEAGAGVFEKFEDAGEIVCVATPAGRTAATLHIGPYQQLGSAHSAVRAWCAANGYALEGTNWEIYGHWDPDPARTTTEVLYLISPALVN